jgi:hypothetical protein
MVYLCGADLESKSSMATSDIVEMTKAKLSNKVNVILYTGGCTKWKNNIITSRTNQIYQVKDGSIKAGDILPVAVAFVYGNYTATLKFNITITE